MSKKTFTDAFNPVLQFITNADENQEVDEQNKNVPMKPNSLYIETKSKRVQLLLQPSTYTKIRSLAENNNNSFNDFVNQILIKYINEQEV